MLGRSRAGQPLVNLRNDAQAARGQPVERIAHLGDEENPDPAAWRAAIKVLELRFGPAMPDTEEVTLPINADQVTRHELATATAACRPLVVGEAPEHTSVITTVEPAKT